jgi:arginine deiminase
MNPINVKSEIKPLKKVLVHRPGRELLNLTPDSLSRLLFDDIPYLPVAKEEHDEFVRIMRDNGVEVVYLEDLMTEVLDINDEIRNKFITQFIYEAGIRTPKYRGLVYDYLTSIENNRLLVLKTMEGIANNEVLKSKARKGKSLVDSIEEDTSFVVDPMPNLYFTRDPFASIGNGISLNKMYSITRNRETIYAEYIFEYHPDYKDKVDKYFDRYSEFHIEGGDILNLNDKILAIGISQRTQASAIENLAKNVFEDPDSTIDTILAFVIPNCRAFMHLDTVFTQVDYDKFTYHPGIMDTLQVFEIKSDDEGGFNVKEKNASLEKILKEYLEKDITLIPCAGGDKIAAEREQWNDGSNTLCISPGVVIVYDRNNVTNDILRNHGLRVLEMHGAELSRGRGGPRCMSMPLIRED